MYQVVRKAGDLDTGFRPLCFQTIAQLIVEPTMSMTHKLWGGVALAAIVAALLMLRTAPNPALRLSPSPVFEPSKPQRPPAGIGDHSRAPHAANEERGNDVATSPHTRVTLPVGLTRVLGSQPERLDRLEATFNRWHRTQPELAAKLVGILAERFGVAAEERVESVWTQAELHQAMALVADLRAIEDRLPLLSELATLLATVDPAGALQFLESFQNVAEKEQFLGEVLDGWTRSDPAGAASGSQTVRDRRRGPGGCAR